MFATQLKYFANPGRAFRYGGEEFYDCISRIKQLAEVEETSWAGSLKALKMLWLKVDPSKEQDIRRECNGQPRCRLATLGESPDGGLNASRRSSVSI